MAAFLKRHYGIILILLAPLVLYVANKSWFFPITGGPSDDWIMVGLFAKYGHASQFFGWYKADRLSWILKGWLFYRLFLPIVGYYLLNFFIFNICTISFYFISKLLFNKKVAVIAALALATYTQFHSLISFEWDTVMHDAAANLLLTLLFLLLATRRPHWKLYIFFAGTTCASAFQSPFVAIHCFSVMFWYVFLNHNAERRHSLIRSGILFLSGIIVMTISYCTINYLLGGPFVYFLGQVPGHSPVLQGLSSYAYKTGYWTPVSKTLFHTKGMLVPVFTCLLSLVVIFYVITQKIVMDDKKNMYLVFFTFFLCIPIPLTFQIMGWPALSFPHWRSGIDPFVFLSLTGLIYFLFVLCKPNEKQTLVIAVTAFTGFCGALAIFGGANIPHKFLITMSVIVAFYLLIRWVPLLKKKYFLLPGYAFVFLFALVNLEASSIPSQFYSLRYRGCGYFSDMYKTVIAGQKVLATFAPNYQVFMWFPYNSNLPFTKEICRRRMPRTAHGKIPLGEAGVFGAISVMAGEGNTTVGYNNMSGAPLLYKTLNTIPHASYWKKYVPRYFIVHPNTQFSAHIPLLLLRNNTLSGFSHEKFWLHVFPKHYKWAIFSKNYTGIKKALHSFNKVGYRLVDQKVEKISSGKITYYMIYGYLDNNRNNRNNSRISRVLE